MHFFDDFPQESYIFKEKVSNIMNKGETRERGKYFVLVLHSYCTLDLVN